MGLSRETAGELADNVWNTIKSFIPDNKKKEVAQNLVEDFEDFEDGVDPVIEKTTLYEVANKDTKDTTELEKKIEKLEKVIYCLLS